MRGRDLACLFPWDQLNDRLLFFPWIVTARGEERLQLFFFFFLSFSFRKEKLPILTSPLSMCLSTKALFEKALWFHNEDKPFQMPLHWPQCTWGSIFILGMAMHLLSAPRPSLHWPTPQILLCSFLSWIRSCPSFYVHILQFSFKT